MLAVAWVACFYSMKSLKIATRIDELNPRKNQRRVLRYNDSIMSMKFEKYSKSKFSSVYTYFRPQLRKMSLFEDVSILIPKYLILRFSSLVENNKSIAAPVQ